MARDVVFQPGSSGSLISPLRAEEVSNKAWSQLGMAYSI
eukprot:CAMPEP_0115425908 /NCGR_PEP_ID=MMETSP0271-20121206/28631_1 /TAXON_ID=71861 /ORGANISM="Scrippsiella trochoidea, Strain CCMP3099" /LENGTH=38 /DNA_ID= /DNA_START= /DNA_END= /DNA_ORIENTATION=